MSIIKDTTIYRDTLYLNEKTVPRKLLVKKEWLSTAEKEADGEIVGSYYYLSLNESSGDYELILELVTETSEDDNFCSVNYTSQKNRISKYIYLAKKFDVLEFFTTLPNASHKKNKKFCNVLVDGSRITFFIEDVHRNPRQRIKQEINITLLKEMHDLKIEIIKIGTKKLTMQNRTKLNKKIYEIRQKHSICQKINYL